MNEPALILADEPTANLDSKMGQELMRLLRRTAREQGRSVVIVSHDQRIKEVADRVLWLEDGQLKELATMAIDPVCGMAVERAQAPTTAWEGRSFVFCSRGCRDEFLEDPARFAGPTAKDAEQDVRPGHQGAAVTDRPSDAKAVCDSGDVL